MSGIASGVASFCRAASHAGALLWGEWRIRREQFGDGGVDFTAILGAELDLTVVVKTVEVDELREQKKRDGPQQVEAQRMDIAHAATGVEIIR